MYKTLINNGINYQPQLVNAGFLNHQRCIFTIGKSEVLRLLGLLDNAMESTMNEDIFLLNSGIFQRHVSFQGCAFLFHQQTDRLWKPNWRTYQFATVRWLENNQTNLPTIWWFFMVMNPMVDSKASPENKHTHTRMSQHWHGQNTQ